MTSDMFYLTADTTVVMNQCSCFVDVDVQLFPSTPDCASKDEQYSLPLMQDTTHAGLNYLDCHGCITKKMDRPVVPLYLSVAFWMVCSREVVMYWHYIAHGDKELDVKQQPLSDMSSAGGP